MVLYVYDRIRKLPLCQRQYMNIYWCYWKQNAFWPSNPYCDSNPSPAEDIDYGLDSLPPHLRRFQQGVVPKVLAANTLGHPLGLGGLLLPLLLVHSSLWIVFQSDIRHSLLQYIFVKQRLHLGKTLLEVENIRSILKAAVKEGEFRNYRTEPDLWISSDGVREKQLSHLVCIWLDTTPAEATPQPMNSVILKSKATWQASFSPQKTTPGPGVQARCKSESWLVVQDGTTSAPLQPSPASRSCSNPFPDFHHK